MTVPRNIDLMQPILDVLHTLEREFSNNEIEELVGINLELSKEDRTKIGYTPNKTRLGYNLEWARTYLSRGGGLIESPKLAFWVLSEKGRETKTIEPREIYREYRNLKKRENEKLKK